MISVTTDIDTFFEGNHEPYIYGAGRSGEILGQYMNRCAYPFAGYVDKNGSEDGAITLNGHSIYNLNYLINSSRDETVYLVIASVYYEQILTELLLRCENESLDVVCLVPISEMPQRVWIKKYNVNRMIGYFRKKLLHGKFPIVISNDCLGTFLFDMFDVTPNAPYLCSDIRNQDYLKLCKNPRYYLGLTPESFCLGWDSQNQEKCLIAQIGDVELRFPHELENKSFEEAQKYICAFWNEQRQKIDVNNDKVIFLWSDRNGIPSDSIMEELQKENCDVFYVFQRDHGMRNLDNKKILYLSKNWFFDTEGAIENHFDVLDWMNRIIDSQE